jgi:hypothetical protein
MVSRSKVTVSGNRTSSGVKVLDPSVTMQGADANEWIGALMKVTPKGQKRAASYEVQFEWTKSRGVARPSKLTITMDKGAEVSSDVLRSIPIKELKRVDTEILRKVMSSTQRQIDILNSLQDHPFFIDGKNPAKTVLSSTTKKPRKLGTRITDEHFAEVARLYKTHLAVGTSNISMAIGRETGYASSTIRKHILECRKRGLLEKLPKKK